MVHLVFAWLLVVGLFIFADPATSTCSGCVVEPESPMNQGARAGAFVLLGVAGLILTALVAVLLSWKRRAAES